MKQNKETLKQFFETGDKPTQQQYANLIDSYVDAKQPEGEANRRFVIDETGEVSVASEQQVPEYSLSPISGTNTVDLLKDGVSVSQIDLTPYLDNTNLARLVSGTVDANGLATFTRDDNSTFTVDLSNLKEDLTNIDATRLNSQPASYYDFRNYGLGGKAIVSNDWNSVTESGFYYNTSTTALGIPTSKAYMSLTHIETDTDKATQKAIWSGGIVNEEWTRYKNGGFWRSWVKVWDSGNFNPDFFYAKVVVAFANLPASPSIGDIATITDAGTVTYRGVASGGGSNIALVMYDGANWIYH